MSLLNPTKKVLEIAPEQLVKLIAQDLEVPEDKIEVKYVISEVGGDPMDRYRGTPQVTKIEVTINS